MQCGRVVGGQATYHLTLQMEKNPHGSPSLRKIQQDSDLNHTDSATKEFVGQEISRSLSDQASHTFQRPDWKEKILRNKQEVKLASVRLWQIITGADAKRLLKSVGG